MIRSGLSIDLIKLKNAGFAAVKLSFIPCIIEAVTNMLTSLYVFFDTDMKDSKEILVAGILGFILSAISPAVIVSSMI